MKKIFINDTNNEEVNELNDFLNSNLPELPDLIEIYTCRESKPKTDCNWFYTIADDSGCSIKKASGKAEFCNCRECQRFGDKKYEYYSLLQALTALQGFSGANYIDLWVSSDSFISDHSEELLEHYGQFHKCPFLQMLGLSLNAELEKRNIGEIFHYSYANRDIIKMFF